MSRDGDDIEALSELPEPEPLAEPEPLPDPGEPEVPCGVELELVAPPVALDCAKATDAHRPAASNAADQERAPRTKEEF